MTFDLPMPPTANNLYFNLPRRGRAKTPEYCNWITTAGWELAKQKRDLGITKFKEPVSLLYEVQRGRRDLANSEKAVTDLLVKCGVLEDDGPDYVHEITMRWAVVRGVRVTIVPVASNETTEGQRDGKEKIRL